MTNEKKSFFKERTESEIKDLNRIQVYNSRDLVDRILSINHGAESLELRFMLLPFDFYRFGVTGAEASRKCYKHGNYLKLQTPVTLEDTLNSRSNPLSYRVKALKQLEEIPEEKIDAIGYAFRPAQLRDRRERRVPFVWLLEGARLFSYAEKRTSGIKIEPYDDSERVSTEGASIAVKIPSRRKKEQRYLAKLQHIPIKDNEWKRVIWRSLTSTYHEGKEVPHSTYNIRYRFLSDIEGSNILTFYPHDIASYWSIVKYYKEKEKNIIPWQMDPFAKPSKLAVNFYLRLCNNILVYDYALESKDKLRKLHVAEKSLLLGRLLGVKGHDETFFWNPKRDPKKIADYEWKIPIR